MGTLNPTIPIPLSTLRRAEIAGVMERCSGPSGLHNDDEDDDDECHCPSLASSYCAVASCMPRGLDLSTNHIGANRKQVFPDEIYFSHFRLLSTSHILNVS